MSVWAPCPVDVVAGGTAASAMEIKRFAMAKKKNEAR